MFLTSPCFRTQRNHVCLRCFPIQLSKNPASPKGRQDCQTPPSVSSGMFPCDTNPFRLTRTNANYSIFSGWKDRNAVTAGTADLTCRRRLCQRRRGNCREPEGGSCYFSQPPASGSADFHRCPPANHCWRSSYRSFVRDPYRVGTVHNRAPAGAIPEARAASRG